jgi:hypothetical protein
MAVFLTIYKHIHSDSAAANDDDNDSAASRERLFKCTF